MHINQLYATSIVDLWRMHWNQIAESLFVFRCKLYIVVLANRQQTTYIITSTIRWVAVYMGSCPKETINHTWIFQVCKICAISPNKTYQKNRNFTYMEDPGMTIRHYQDIMPCMVLEVIFYPSVGTAKLQWKFSLPNFQRVEILNLRFFYK